MQLIEHGSLGETKQIPKKVIFLYYTYPNQIDLLSPYFQNAYIAEMSSNIMGEKDLSLDFLLSFYPDLLHPYEFLRTTKSGVSKVINKKYFKFDRSPEFSLNKN